MGAKSAMSISLNRGLQMGGDNSGWWGGTHGRMPRRMRVEKCDVLLPIEGFRPWLMENGGDEPLVLFIASCCEGAWFKTVDMTPRCRWERPRKPDDWCRFIDVEPHPWPLYGTRWFFRCACNRRCDVLYAKRHDGPILCRICHNLSYASTQEYNMFKRTTRGPIRL